MLFRVPDPLVNIAHFSEIVRKRTAMAIVLTARLTNRPRGITAAFAQPSADQPTSKTYSIPRSDFLYVRDADSACTRIERYSNADGGLML